VTYDLPGALHRRGLKVELVPGWETRGVSDLRARGSVSHWTGGPRGTTGRPSLSVVINGRPDLKGPLCNVYLDRAGVAVVVAARTAQHAGLGGWKGLRYNSEVFGTEAECAGDGDWTAAQKAAYPKVNAAYCDLGGFGPDMCCGHNEWAPDRKIDIRDFTMTTMRRGIAAVLAPAPTPVPAHQEDDMFMLHNRRGDLYICGPGFAEHVNETQDDLRKVLPTYEISDDMCARIIKGIAATKIQP